MNVVLRVKRNLYGHACRTVRGELVSAGPHVIKVRQPVYSHVDPTRIAGYRTVRVMRYLITVARPLLPTEYP